MLRSLIRLYRAGGMTGCYRYLSARFHIALSDVLGRWSMWHANMARLIVDDEMGRTGGW